jgi:hypothetical protein
MQALQVTLHCACAVAPSGFGGLNIPLSTGQARQVNQPIHSLKEASLPEVFLTITSRI